MSIRISNSDLLVRHQTPGIDRLHQSIIVPIRVWTQYELHFGLCYSSDMRRGYMRFSADISLITILR